MVADGDSAKSLGREQLSGPRKGGWRMERQPDGALLWVAADLL